MMTIISNDEPAPARREHPAVTRARARLTQARETPAVTPAPLTMAELRTLALSAGVDDVSVVSVFDPLVDSEREHVQRALPRAQTLIVLVKRMHPDNLRSPQRSVANVEFAHTGFQMDESALHLARDISARGFVTISPAMAFPMEMDQFPGRTWIVSHKVAAHAAGLGVIGLHRNLIHPTFGSHILLGTLITEATVARERPVLDESPCIDCKLCVAACPVGAIEPDGGFRFSACYDHNYREFMTGFSDLLEAVADSKDHFALREKQTLSEQASAWQSLASKPVYKAAYCLAVCPAGDDVLGPFVSDRAGFVQQVLKPLTAKEETVYAVKGSDAAAHVQQRFPHKRLRIVSSSLRPTSVEGFFAGSSLTFQRGPARGLRATFHFDFNPETTDGPRQQATFVVNDGALDVQRGLHGRADVTVSGDGQVWLGVVAKERSPVWAVVRRRLKIAGDRALLDRFAACFPR